MTRLVEDQNIVAGLAGLLVAADEIRTHLADIAAAQRRIATSSGARIPGAATWAEVPAGVMRFGVLRPLGDTSR
jgi:hypothetical protein